MEQTPHYPVRHQPAPSVLRRDRMVTSSCGLTFHSKESDRRWQPRDVAIFRVAVLAAVCLALAACARPEKRYSLTRPMMGTVVKITVCHRDPKIAYQLIEKGFAEFQRIEQLMSTRIATSEVSRINRKGYPGPLVIDPEVFSLLQRAKEYSRLTHGAFDVTVGPLLRLWPLYRKEKILPGGAEIRSALERVGADYMVLDAKTRSLRFLKPGMAIDLGGIAKGYAIARVIDLLRSAGVKDALVDAGGDLYALGTRPDGSSWRVGIRHPRRAEQLIAVLAADNLAIMTSGDYERYFMKNGRRYSHIVDPRTGYTARGTASVTITAPDATMADALATGVLVLGAEKGIEVVESIANVEAAILSEGSSNKLKLTVSSGFEKLLKVNWENLDY